MILNISNLTIWSMSQTIYDINNVQQKKLFCNCCKICESDSSSLLNPRACSQIFIIVKQLPPVNIVIDYTTK